MRFWIPALFLLAAPCWGGEKDVWYDASGKVVKTTEPVVEKEPFVADWQKREAARLEAQRTGNYSDRVYHRSRSSWYHGYPHYGGYYYGSAPRYHYSGHHRNRGHGHSRWGFRGSYHGSYHGNGWSVRVGY
ncbi:hypothetical protein JO972_10280 [Verrucomicrobiaceae bacterium 5K15]|uniref:Uncharacterized protein n=1 Tax=Oceaniferula flava TaxID=2800421 RepID=A0AAE2SBU3_9BACT|nr:hypothetical protein [Oceaniferula flavus]MBK1855346.1 hypothetical protein [Oceaniferula flavus]MBM1136652.1 hypothetical protein [Oceaniferula flavus]